MDNHLLDGILNLLINFLKSLVLVQFGLEDVITSTAGEAPAKDFLIGAGLVTIGVTTAVTILILIGLLITVLAATIGVAVFSLLVAVTIIIGGVPATTTGVGVCTITVLIGITTGVGVIPFTFLDIVGLVAEEVSEDIFCAHVGILLITASIGQGGECLHTPRHQPTLPALLIRLNDEQVDGVVSGNVDELLALLEGE